MIIVTGEPNTSCDECNKLLSVYNFCINGEIESICTPCLQKLLMGTKIFKQEWKELK